MKLVTLLLGGSRNLDHKICKIRLERQFWRHFASTQQKKLYNNHWWIGQCQARPISGGHDCNQAASTHIEQYPTCLSDGKPILYEQYNHTISKFTFTIDVVAARFSVSFRRSRWLPNICGRNICEYTYWILEFQLCQFGPNKIVVIHQRDCAHGCADHFSF